MTSGVAAAYLGRSTMNEFRVRSRPCASVVLEIDSVTAGYGGAPVISDVSLHTRAGRITAIVGPNGAGKSTLLKALLWD